MTIDDIQGAIEQSIAATEEGKAKGKPILLPGGLGSINLVALDMPLRGGNAQSGTLTAALTVGTVMLDVSGQLDKGRLRLTIPQGSARLSDILASMGVAVPPQLPLVDAEGDFHIEYLASCDELQAEFAVMGKITADWELHGSALPTCVDFNFRRSAVAGRPQDHHDTGRLAITLAKGGAAVLVADFMTLTDVDMVVTYDAGAWSGHGNLATVVLDKAFALRASLQHSKEKSSFTLATADASKAIVIPIDTISGAALKNLDFNLEVVQDAANVRQITGHFSAAMGLSGISDLAVTAGYDKSLSLKINAQGIDFRPLALGLGIPVPDELPDFAFDLVGEASCKDKQWRFDLRVPDARLQWAMGNGVIEANTEGRLIKGSGGFTGHLTVIGKNTVRPIDEFGIEAFKLEYRREKAWAVAGGMDLEIFGRKCPLIAKYEGADDNARLTLSGMMSGDPVPLPGINDARKAGLGGLDFALELTCKDGEPGYSGFASGRLVGDAFGEQTRVRISLNSEFQLHADANGLVLADIAHALGIAIPDIVPPIVGAYALDVTSDASKQWRLHLTGDLTASTHGGPAWKFAREPFATSAFIDLERAIVDNKPVCSGRLDFVADGQVPLIDGVVFEHFALHFSVVAGEAWAAHSDARLAIFDHSVDTDIDYVQNNDKESLTFRVKGAPTLHLAGAQIETKTISVTLSHEKDETCWDFTAEGVRLQAGEWIDVTGTLAVGLNEKKQTLTLRPDAATLVIEPRVLEATTVLHLDQLRFEHTDTGWSVAGDVRTALTQLPQPLCGLLPQPLKRLVDPSRGLESVFTAGSDGISVTMTEFMAPIEIDTKTSLRSPDGKPITGADKQALPDVDFGKAAVKASDFKLSLSSDPSVSIKFGLALPSKLNNAFGTNDAGQPVHEVFEVYSGRENKTSFVMLEASISAESGISVVWGGGLPFKTKDRAAVKDGCWTISLGNDGEYGEFTIEVPRLSYTGTAFEASGGCYLNEDKPLEIPLGLLQQVLIQAGFKDIAESLPRKVTMPLELSVIEKDEEQWRLKDPGSQQLVDWMEDITGSKLPLIRAALDKLSHADVVPLLPNALCEYLAMPPPERPHIQARHHTRRRCQLRGQDPW